MGLRGQSVYNFGAYTLNVSIYPKAEKGLREGNSKDEGAFMTKGFNLPEGREGFKSNARWLVW